MARFDQCSKWNFKSLALLLTIAANIFSCGQPSGKLTETEREAELNWVIGKFEHNYAPLKYKESLHKFNWEDLKKDYLAKAKADQSNAEFTLLLKEFVSTFKDAHTGIESSWDGLPGKVTVAALGFTGGRVNFMGINGLLVTDLFPSNKVGGTSFPVQIGDVVTKVDGQAIYKFARNLCPLDLGNEESNKTALIPEASFLTDLTCRLPEKDSTTLTILRNGAFVEIKLPWVKEDYFDLTEREQAASILLNSGLADQGQPEEVASETDKSWEKPLGTWSLREFYDHIKEAALMSPMARQKQFAVRYISSKMLLQPLGLKTENKLTQSSFPAIMVNNTEVDSLEVKNESFTARLFTHNNAMVGYIKIEAFSGGDFEVAEFEKSINKMKSFGAKSLIIDLVNNGGGSLEYGLKLANLLKKKKRTEPELEVRLNDNWINSYHSESVMGGNSLTREIAKRRYDKFILERKNGDFLSSRFKFSENLLGPEPSKFYDFKVFIMVNEMCASMCDIFTADLKDNGVATVLGNQTMGAGGNVTQHALSPRLGLILSQTESLVVRANGSYLENKGVMPDIKYERTPYDLLFGDVDFIGFTLALATK